MAAAFGPNTSTSKVLCFLFNAENQYIIYETFSTFIKSLNILSEIFPDEMSLRSSNVSNVHING